MNNNIILKFDKLKEVEVQNTGNFIEIETTTSIIANSITVYKNCSSSIMHKSIFEDRKEFNSMITNINNEIKAVISALDNLNIQSSILIEINDIYLDADVDQSDLSDFYNDDLI
ncbi:hypothetical protein [Clostridioides difficile]|uniref:hypothetical protein n=1 Tax=Clostridioides difficile TaxID=1496 RepID=UPI00132E7C69|nr:hypothetical protein [Clostridioides difficile]EGT4878869.1 hypothetical protein [Clostridioides difficile]QHG01375.1 hypothetical protein DF008_12160 [Clostridioides difficile]HBF5713002.1 hypothetical protein [Clostridioides difficile]HBH1627625.1 hypothetical protein [Clostridioides difficile]HBH3601385.1 hypothetical protein [Clostridioides difficile]